MRLAGAILVLLLGSATADASEPVAIPGTRVRMPIPEGFVLATRFAGIEMSGTAVAIKVSELPVGVEELRGKWTPEALGPRGMRLLESDTTKIDGRPADLLWIGQEVQGVLFVKWVLLTGTHEQSLLVVASRPKDSPDELSEVLERTLRAAHWNPEVALDPFQGLDFRLVEGRRLRFSRRVGTMLILTEGGTRAPLAPTDPLLLAGEVERDPAESADLDLWARERIRQTPRTIDHADVQEREIELAGRQARELVASARHESTGDPLTLFLTVVPAPGERRFVVQGVVGASRADLWLDEFRAIAASLEPPPTGSAPTP